MERAPPRRRSFRFSQLASPIGGACRSLSRLDRRHLRDGRSRLPGREFAPKPSPDRSASRSRPARRPCRAGYRARRGSSRSRSSVPRIIGALTWPMWATRKALPERSPMPWPRITPHLLVAIGAQRLGIVAVHQHAGDRVGALAGLDDVEADRLAFRPDADGAAHRLGQQPMAPEHVLEPLLEQHVERLAQAEQQMLGRRAGIFLVVLRRPRGRSSPSRACAARPSCAPRARGRWPRRSPGPAASSCPSASPTWRRRRPRHPSRTACSRARPPRRPSAARRAWPRVSPGRSPAMSFTTPDAVSICATSTALMVAAPCRP